MDAKNLITVAGIFSTLVISVGNLIYSIINNRKTTFVNTVTVSRLKWIDSLRDKVSEFIAISARLADPAAAREDLMLLPLQRDTLRHQIALHLNPLDLDDQKILSLADHVCELIEKHESGALPAANLKLRNATGVYLKKEWNRVKRESGDIRV